MSDGKKTASNPAGATLQIRLNADQSKKFNEMLLEYNKSHGTELKNSDFARRLIFSRPYAEDFRAIRLSLKSIESNVGEIRAACAAGAAGDCSLPAIVENMVRLEDACGKFRNLIQFALNAGGSKEPDQVIADYRTAMEKVGRAIAGLKNGNNKNHEH